MLLLFFCILNFSGTLSIPAGNNILRSGDTSDRQITEEDVIDFNALLSNLPKHLSVLPHQAGGHLFDSDKRTIGMLKDSRGYILKKAPKEELNFYKDVQNGFYPKLAPLIPAFHGTVSVPFKDKTMEFTALEDLTRGFEKPCVLDVKIGERTWSPDATEEKIIGAKKRCTACKEAYGFFISGCVTTDPKTNKVTRYTKNCCKSLTPESLITVIERFVKTGSYEATAILVKRIIEELKKIQEWASTQTELRIYASSVIIVYDSQALFRVVPNKNHHGSSSDFVRVKLIDFAHVHKAPENEGVDTNYLRGVNNLLKIFEDILTNSCAV